MIEDKIKISFKPFIRFIIRWIDDAKTKTDKEPVENRVTYKS